MSEPLFTYVRGHGRMRITPRTGKGWAALVAFILLVTAPGMLLPSLLERSPWLLVPYLVWVGFAGVLNWKVVELNEPFSGP